MRTINEKLISMKTSITDAVNYVEIFGTSAESKPTSGIATGSVFVEVDTGNAFFYNETASSWVQQ